MALVGIARLAAITGVTWEELVGWGHDDHPPVFWQNYFSEQTVKLELGRLLPGAPDRVRDGILFYREDEEASRSIFFANGDVPLVTLSVCLPYGRDISRCRFKASTSAREQSE